MNPPTFDQLTEVSEETAKNLFPNWAIFWLEDGLLLHRCWFTEVDNKHHVFPDNKKNYFVRKKALTE